MEIVAGMDMAIQERVRIHYFLPLFDSEARVVQSNLYTTIASIGGHFRLIRLLARNLSLSGKFEEIDIDEGGETAGFHAVWLEPFVNEGQQGKSILLP